MERMILDHIGIVVKDIDEALSRYQNMLGLKLINIGVIHDKKAGLKLGLLPIGDKFLELIEPLDPEHRCAKFLEKHGEGLFHISIFVEEYEKEVNELSKKGYTVTEEDGELGPGRTIKLGWLLPDTTGGPHIELVDIKQAPKFE
ncbi:MAG: VOC family protein [Deltaproteobacteria bacterium]|nr:VOC family protein [Deltaproteobacteria bacterium]